MNYDFWINKRVYLTGHTGFKGGWTVAWLKKMGANVKGYALEPDLIPSFVDVTDIKKDIESEFGDIRNLDLLKKSMLDFAPEIVIHMAAQPLVRRSYQEPILTYQTNVMGTVNLLEAVRSCSSVKAVVNVTSDKCYENKEWLWAYRENESMGGYDPYSSSKGCSELITSSYRRSFFNSSSSVALASARAGNVIGGGDWSADRLIPDSLNAFEKKIPAVIRNPMAIRPWQHVLEPICGYLMLAEKLYEFGNDFAESWNFGPSDTDARPVSEVMDYLVKEWPGGASWVLDDLEQPHEAQILKLDISKAKARLKWEPSWNLERAIQSIIEWHQAWLEDKDIHNITLKQIEDYELSIRNEK